MSCQFSMFHSISTVLHFASFLFGVPGGKWQPQGHSGRGTRFSSLYSEPPMHSNPPGGLQTWLLLGIVNHVAN